MIKVFRLNDLIKYAIKIIVPLVVIFFIIKFVGKILNTETSKSVSSKAVSGIIDDSIDLIKTSNKNEEEQKPKEWGKVVLDSEFEILNLEEQENTNTVKEEANEVKSEEIPAEKTEEVVQAKTEVPTEEVPNSVKPKYNTEYASVKINNSSEHELSEDLLNTDDVNVNKKKVLIYHTHTCESYTPTEQFFYEETGSYRTTDLNYTVARVGDELERQLSSYGCEVIHDKTTHDYPSYNGSYSRSLKTAQGILADNQDIDIVIDLHRDAIGDSSYAPKVKIGDEYASQLMFVIGTDKANPEHTTWNQNLKFAVKTQQTANELYPGLFKPIILRGSTYNQNVAKAACIIEVGATGNTLEESINSMKYLAKILNN